MYVSFYFKYVWMVWYKYKKFSAVFIYDTSLLGNNNLSAS